jgi:hypothetical protein
VKIKIPENIPTITYIKIDLEDMYMLEYIKKFGDKYGTIKILIKQGMILGGKQIIYMEAHNKKMLWGLFDIDNPPSTKLLPLSNLNLSERGIGGISESNNKLLLNIIN